MKLKTTCDIVLDDEDEIWIPEGTVIEFEATDQSAIFPGLITVTYEGTTSDLSDDEYERIET